MPCCNDVGSAGENKGGLAAKFMGCWASRAGGMNSRESCWRCWDTMMDKGEERAPTASTSSALVTAAADGV